MDASISPRARRLAFVLATWLFAAARADENAPCYFPGQGLARDRFAPGYYPCQSDAFITSCCPAGWTCFSNALCIATTESNSFPNITLGAVQRGACTNPLWNNNICGSACLAFENTAGDLAACGNDRFCCEGDFDNGRCNCSTNGGAFPISAGIAQTIIGVTDTTFTGKPSLSIATTPPSVRTTTRTSGSARTTPTTLSTSRQGTSSTPAATSSTVPSTDVPTEAPANAPASDDSSSKNLKIGLGVGIPLGVIALAGVLALLYFKPWQSEQPPAGSGGSAGSGGGMVEHNYAAAGDGHAGTSTGNAYVGNNSTGNGVVGNDDFNSTSLQLAESDLNGPQIVSHYR